MHEKYFDKLFIFEMANNHMGSVSHAKKIISNFSKLQKKFKFNFAFKLQYRNLKSFIHPNFSERNDLKFIKRFKETELKENDFNQIVKTIKKYKFKSIATPFDEKSVDLINRQHLDYIKVASCSFEDWSLLEKISQFDYPLILSTAGAKIENIDRVVNFFRNRKKIFCLMHCVAIYPTPENSNILSRIDLFKQRYLDIPIGFSTHEGPKNISNIQMAIAKGATVFEKHVGTTNSKFKKLNDYSSNEKQTFEWLESANYAFNNCQTRLNKRNEALEKQTLKSLKRGLFLKKSYKKNKKINFKDIYLAYPPLKNQLTSENFSKYNTIRTKKNIKKDSPLLLNNSKILNQRKKIYNIIKKVNLVIKKNLIFIPDNTPIEISFHYGIENFDKFGLVMFTIINRSYCKKILIIQKNQMHPKQYHKKKEETFNILSGSLCLNLNNKDYILKKGDVITIKKNQVHSFFSRTGCVIEELSNKHINSDSIYLDKAINKNKNRKIILNYWKIPFEKKY